METRNRLFVRGDLAIPIIIFSIYYIYIKMNSWIEFVKAYAKKHNINYAMAVKDPKCKMEYHKSKGK